MHKEIQDGNDICIATTYSSGDTHWFLKSTFMHHRTSGPAVEYINGYEAWYRLGKRHRTDGPAVIHHDGIKEWWVEGTLLDCKNQEEFERLMNLRAFW